MMVGKLVCLLLEPYCGLQYWLVAARGVWGCICDVRCVVRRVTRGSAYAAHGYKCTGVLVSE